jgi:hypothetical protein
LQQSVRGFFQYIDFLERFDFFLKSVQGELNKSAFWYYHQYWFKRINQRMRSTILNFHNGLQKFVAKNREFKQQGGETINRIEVSKQYYFKIVDDLALSDKLGQTLDRFAKEWRMNAPKL